MADSRFPRLVSLACHDLRTPLATIYGFARTLNRMEEHDERTGRFLGMIEEAAEQMTELLDELGAVARIEAGRWDPGLGEADTLELARTDDSRVAVAGEGETIETDAEAVAHSLRSLALAALRHGPVEGGAVECPRPRARAVTGDGRRRPGRQRHGNARPWLTGRRCGDRGARRLGRAQRRDLARPPLV